MFVGFIATYIFIQASTEPASQLEWTANQHNHCAMPPDRRQECVSARVCVCMCVYIFSWAHRISSRVGAVGMFYFIAQFNVGSASVKTHIVRSTLFRCFSSDKFKNTHRLYLYGVNDEQYANTQTIYSTMRYTQYEISYTYFAAITNQKINIRNENIFNFIRGVCSILFHRNEYVVSQIFFIKIVILSHFWLIELRCTYSWRSLFAVYINEHFEIWQFLRYSFVYDKWKEAKNQTERKYKTNIISIERNWKQKQQEFKCMK